MPSCSDVDYYLVTVKPSLTASTNFACDKYNIQNQLNGTASKRDLKASLGREIVSWVDGIAIGCSAKALSSAKITYSAYILLL